MPISYGLLLVWAGYSGKVIVDWFMSMPPDLNGWRGPTISFFTVDGEGPKYVGEYQLQWIAGRMQHLLLSKRRVDSSSRD